jgi:hypothetical protein
MNILKVYPTQRLNRVYIDRIKVHFTAACRTMPTPQDAIRDHIRFGPENVDTNTEPDASAEDKEILAAIGRLCAYTPTDIPGKREYEGDYGLIDAYFTLQSVNYLHETAVRVVANQLESIDISDTLKQLKADLTLLLPVYRRSVHLRAVKCNCSECVVGVPKFWTHAGEDLIAFKILCKVYGNTMMADTQDDVRSCMQTLIEIHRDTSIAKRMWAEWMIQILNTYVD